MRPPNDLKMNETPRHHHDASDSRRGNGGMNRGRGRGHAVSETRRGPSLSYSLLSELGEGDSQQGGGGVRRPGGGQPVTAVAARKARRKQERVDKARRRAEHAVSHTRAEAARRAEEPQEAPVEQRRRRPPPSQGQADGGGRHAGDEDVQAAGPVKKRKRVVSEPVQRAAPVSLDRQRMLDDIEAERSLQSRLAKKLKKYKGPDDGLQDLFHGLSGASAAEASDGDDAREAEPAPKQRRAGAAPSKPDAGAAPAAARYVPPAARARAAASAGGNDVTAEAGRLTRALKGLLNRMGDANVQAITQEIADLPSVMGLPRRALCTALAREVTHALLHGPRASHGYSCALAACVAALSAAIGPDLGAVCMASVAAHLDAARGVGAAEEGANSQGASNLAALLARLFVCGLAPAAVLWGLLHHVTARLSELDVALTLNVLRCAGPKLRSEDPEQLRDFIIALQQRVRDSASGEGTGMTTRARVLLDLVCDIKNGKKGALPGSDDAQVPPHVTRWLRDAGVSVPAAQLCGLTLAGLLEGAAQPETSNWWRRHDLIDGDDAGGVDARQRPGSRGADRDRQGGQGDDDTRRLLQAAAEQRMNTATRRAAFVALMGSDDVSDAAERLLRLGLPPAAERDILRVVLHCCLGESVYNPFYEHVTARLCSAHKRHRVTLQYCVWDAWKAVIVPGDGAYDARQLSHLACFVAGTLLRGALPFSALRGADWSGAQTSAQASAERAGDGLASAHARRVAHLRLLVKALLLPPRTVGDVHALFLRGAGRPQLAPLRAALLQFMRRHVLTDAAGSDAKLLDAVAAAEAGLNGETAPMPQPR